MRGPRKSTRHFSLNQVNKGQRWVKKWFDRRRSYHGNVPPVPLADLPRGLPHPSMTLRCGFSLLELLVVIALVTLLASLLLPVLSSAKASARLLHCKSNLRQLAIAMNVYVADHEVYPAFGTFTPTVMWLERVPS